MGSSYIDVLVNVGRSSSHLDFCSLGLANGPSREVQTGRVAPRQWPQKKKKKEGALPGTERMWLPRGP